MKKRELDHVLRAAGRITHEKQFIIVGSQTLHGRYPDPADEIERSVWVDLFAKNHPEKTENLDAIGVYSPFHELYGYYADPVDEKTATLPQGWRGRWVNLPPGDTEGVLDYVWIRMILRSPSTARREKKIFSSTVSSLGGGSWIARNCCSYYSSPLNPVASCASHRAGFQR